MNSMLDGDKDRMNPFASARGGMSAMQPFAKILFNFVLGCSEFAS